MSIDFTPFFKKYETLVETAENAFTKVSAEYGDCVKCKIECSDCCFALFDISLIEAIYIHHHFMNALDRGTREEVIEKANHADRLICRIKRKAYKAAVDGKEESEIINAMTRERVRCPLLSRDLRCDLYRYRPITCRLYGIPTAFNGVGYTCGISGFEQGKAYPTIHMDIFYRKLYEISLELVSSIRSRHIKMADMLVPVSMALITDYNEEYLGIGDEEEKKEGAGA
jgi:Fe-S-cluster containining protein